MSNRTIVIILPFLLSACLLNVGYKEATYPVVSLDNSDSSIEINYPVVTLVNIHVVKSLAVKPMRLSFKSSLLSCRENDARMEPCIEIPAYDGDEMGSAVVGKFILAYNRRYNTNFNRMKDARIERKVNFASTEPKPEGVYYFISGTLLEIAGEPYQEKHIEK